MADLKNNNIKIKINVFSFDQIRRCRRCFSCEAKVWQDVSLTACLMSPLTWQGSWLGAGCSVVGFTHRLSFPLHRKQVIDVLLLCWSALFDLFIHLSRTEQWSCQNLCYQAIKSQFSMISIYVNSSNNLSCLQYFTVVNIHITLWQTVRAKCDKFNCTFPGVKIETAKSA